MIYPIKNLIFPHFTFPDGNVFLQNSCNSLTDYFFDLKMSMFCNHLPPSQSRRTRREVNPFPLGGNKKGGFKSKNQCFYVTEILKHYMASFMIFLRNWANWTKKFNFLFRYSYQYRIISFGEENHP